MSDGGVLVDAMVVVGMRDQRSELFFSCDVAACSGEMVRIAGLHNVHCISGVSVEDEPRSIYQSRSTSWCWYQSRSHDHDVGDDDMVHKGHSQCESRNQGHLHRDDWSVV